jgi:anti-anti-sigma regulatory factor
VIKITRNGEHANCVVLKIEGRLAAAWVEEFARAVGAAMTEDAQVTLDLGGLSFADDRGVAVIRGARDRGARLTGASQFIGALINEDGSR